MDDQECSPPRTPGWSALAGVFFPCDSEPNEDKASTYWTVEPPPGYRSNLFLKAAHADLPDRVRGVFVWIEERETIGSPLHHSGRHRTNWPGIWRLVRFWPPQIVEGFLVSDLP